MVSFYYKAISENMFKSFLCIDFRSHFSCMDHWIILYKNYKDEFKDHQDVFTTNTKSQVSFMSASFVPTDLKRYEVTDIEEV